MTWLCVALATSIMLARSRKSECRRTDAALIATATILLFRAYP